MFIDPNLATQLAREHQRELLAEASQRQQLQHRHRPAPGTPGATGIARRLAAAIVRAGAVAAQAPGAIWPAGPRPLGEPAGRAQTPGHSH
jgi:hypothetical protein